QGAEHPGGADQLDGLVRRGAVPDEITEADDGIRPLLAQRLEHGFERQHVRVDVADDAQDHGVSLPPPCRRWEAERATVPPAARTPRGTPPAGGARTRPSPPGWRRGDPRPAVRSPPAAPPDPRRPRSPGLARPTAPGGARTPARGSPSTPPRGPGPNRGPGTRAGRRRTPP